MKTFNNVRKNAEKSKWVYLQNYLYLPADCQRLTSLIANKC